MAGVFRAAKGLRETLNESMILQGILLAAATTSSHLAKTERLHVTVELLLAQLVLRMVLRHRTLRLVLEA